MNPGSLGRGVPAKWLEMLREVEEFRSGAGGKSSAPISEHLRAREEREDERWARRVGRGK